MPLLKLYKKPTKRATVNVDEWILVKEDDKHIYLSPAGELQARMILRVDRAFKSDLKFKESSPLGDLIRESRETQGMSQHDLALKSGVSQMTISNIESSACDSVNTSTLDPIVVALSIPMDKVYEACKPE